MSEKIKLDVYVIYTKENGICVVGAYQDGKDFTNEANEILTDPEVLTWEKRTILVDAKPKEAPVVEEV